ncbi:MAG: type II toxin-antitoxin system HicA family toxin [Patescibacteria group bacterium]
MPKIGNINWQKFEKFLFTVGCQFKREKGDHRIYRKHGIKRPVVVPRDKILPEFIILKNLRTLGISREEYLKIIQRI